MKLPGVHQSMAVGTQESRVAFGTRERLEKLEGFARLAGAKFGVRVEECDAALMGREPVGPAKEQERVRFGAADGGKLPRAKKRSRRDGIFPDAFGGLG